MAEQRKAKMSKHRLSIYCSESYDPAVNLAIEECLLCKASKGETVLYLWQNDNTVVIGRNQNPYLQCDMEYAKKNGVHVVRRLSGGGAVYHDRGNLNYTVIQTREDFSIDENFDMVLSCLSHLGICAKKDGRNDLTAGGRKFSGTAFHYGEKACYQHGCILVGTDIDRMERCLNVLADKFAGKDIKSVRARVINLAHMLPGLNVVDVRAAFVDGFSRAHASASMKAVSGVKAGRRFPSVLRKYRSAKWNLGDSIDMKAVLHRRFPWGDCSLVMATDGKSVRGFKVFTDSLLTEDFDAIERVIRGASLSKQELLEALALVESGSGICSDIGRLVKEELHLYGGQ